MTTRRDTPGLKSEILNLQSSFASLPVLGICGYSGAGKTTLIEALVPWLVAKGLKVLTLKHDVHGLDIDKPGKDSDRFYRAGSDVFLNGPGECLARMHQAGGGPDLYHLLGQRVQQYDLILVEGHKFTPLPHRIWLRRGVGDRCPGEIKAMCDLGRACDRQAVVRKLINSWLVDVWKRTPVYGGILVGGESRRMGTPKHLIKKGRQTWLEAAVAKVRPFVQDVVLLGRGEIPESLKRLAVLPDVEGVRGPRAGMLSAMRWNPRASWLFMACDLPMVTGGAFKWLLSKRAPGTWAVVPELAGKGTVEPLLAYYDFRAKAILEECARPMDMAAKPKVLVARPPARLAAAWTNVNTPEERNQVR